MTEPDFPYDKHPKEGENTIVPPPLPPQPPQPPMPSIGIGEGPSKHACKICGKTFNSKEELRLHMDMEHQSPKKKV